MRQGRPLRFIGQVLLGWVALRAIMLWPATDEGGPRVVLAERRPAQIGASMRTAQPPPKTLIAAPAPPRAWPAGPINAATGQASPPKPGASPPRGWSAAVAQALLDQSVSFARQPGGTTYALLASAAPGLGQVNRQVALAAQPSAVLQRPLRPGEGDGWSGSAWMVLRAAGGVAGGPLLGGAQAGIRIERALGTGRSEAPRLHARLSGPIESPAAEAALGVSARPLPRLPVTLAVEARRRLATGGRSGLAAYLAGGVDRVPLAPRVTLDGYAQAGIIGAPGSAAFVDGQLSVGYEIAGQPQGRDLRIALRADGAAQPGASRLDVGPSLDLRLPVRDAALRLSAGWRQRALGDARPASGPALVLISTF